MDPENVVRSLQQRRVDERRVLEPHRPARDPFRSRHVGLRREIAAAVERIAVEQPAHDLDRASRAAAVPDSRTRTSGARRDHPSARSRSAHLRSRGAPRAHPQTRIPRRTPRCAGELRRASTNGDDLGSETIGHWLHVHAIERVIERTRRVEHLVEEPRSGPGRSTRSARRPHRWPTGSAPAIAAPATPARLAAWASRATARAYRTPARHARHAATCRSATCRPIARPAR